jgi:hypothetical protein
MNFADVIDIHTYPEPSVPSPNPKYALINGEFGSVGWLLPERSWEPKGGGKINVSSYDDLYYTYTELMGQVKVLKEKHNLSGTVYTELTDVETEVNGLLFYDRTPKVPIKNMLSVNGFHFQSPRYRDILPLSQTTPQEWKHAFSEPAGGKTDWTKASYDDSVWEEGPGAFDADYEHVGTNWPAKKDLWLRKKFRLGDVSPVELDRAVITLYCLGLVGETYINSVKFPMQHTGNRLIGSLYEHRPFTVEVRRALVLNGENIIAIHCVATSQPRYVLDVAFAVREE